MRFYIVDEKDIDEKDIDKKGFYIKYSMTRSDYLKFLLEKDIIENHDSNVFYLINKKKEIREIRKICEDCG